MPSTTFPRQQPRVLAKAAFTQDMVDTLNTIFEAYATEGVLDVEVTTFGLWLVEPTSNRRQFLGAARVPDSSSH